MFAEDPKAFFESVLFQSLGKDTEVFSYRMITGGCINNAQRVETSRGTFLLKWNENAEQDMFETEKKGLQILGSVNEIRIPEVISTGTADGKHFILMEFIEKSIPNKTFWSDFGTQLASLHKHTSNKYGLDHNNYIGKLPQKNNFKDNWVDFFIENRLEVQLGLGIYNGLVTNSFAKQFRNLYPQLPGLLSDQPASLLHGDLWSGNFMTGDQGEPVILDPAVYYGNREIEIAFTQLFGGFDREFYDSYFESFPVDESFQERAEIYNLYPLLVHVNLFGKSYLSSVERVIRKYY